MFDSSPRTLQTDIVYGDPTKKVWTVLENQVEARDTFAQQFRLSRHNIKGLTTIDVFRVYGREDLPLLFILFRRDKKTASGSYETTLKGDWKALGNHWIFKSQLNELW